MGFSLPAFKYPPARPEEGFWAPVTSTINWCEEDYYATIYSAEIINTLTNLLFIALGIKGIRNCLKYKHDDVFLVAFVGYLLVGSGSFAFHSTLKYPMQLVDELSMIYTACLMCYATFSFSQSRLVRQLLGAGLLSLAVFITFYYHFLQKPAFHQNAFAILTAFVLFRSMYIMEVNIRPRKRVYAESGMQQESLQQATNDERDKVIIKQMWLMVALGLSIFLGGFCIWTLDRIYCTKIRRWRHAIGLPWGILLEGHGWWHIMTGIGSYFYIAWAIWLRHCLNDRKEEYVLSWPNVFTLPEIISFTDAEKSASWRKSVVGQSNGYVRAEERKSV